MTQFCYECERDVELPKFCVCIDSQGGYVTDPSDAATFSEHNYRVVGPHCAKKLRKHGVIIWEYGTVSGFFRNRKPS